MFDFLKYFNIFGTKVELPKEELAWKTTVITPVEEPEPIKPEPPPEVVSDWVAGLVKRIDQDEYYFIQHEDIILHVPLDSEGLFINCNFPKYFLTGRFNQSLCDLTFHLGDESCHALDMNLTTLEQDTIGGAIFRCRSRMAEKIKKNFI